MTSTAVPYWYSPIGSNCGSSHENPALNHTNLHYWRDGFDSLFAQNQQYEYALAAIRDMVVDGTTGYEELTALMRTVAKIALGEA